MSHEASLMDRELSLFFKKLTTHVLQLKNVSSAVVLKMYIAFLFKQQASFFPRPLYYSKTTQLMPKENSAM